MVDTLRSLLDAHGARLITSGVSDADSSLAWFVSHVTGKPRSWWRSRMNDDIASVLTADDRERLAELVARRARREPVQYLIGEADFRRLTLRVGPGVLIPRPETEEVAGCAIEAACGYEHPRVLDVGTGSGCIALAIADEVPGAEVIACDVSDTALGIARSNAERLGLRVAFHQADLLADVLDVPGMFDVIVSNPPYVAEDEEASLEPEVRDHEPHLALFAPGDVLLFYRALVRHATTRLRPGGTLVLETHADHADATAALLTPDLFVDVTMQHDTAGRPRIVRAVRRSKSVSGGAEVTQ